MKPAAKDPEAHSAPPDSAPEASSSSKGTDVVLVHGVTEDGTGLQVLRHRDARLEAGVLHRVDTGKPIHGELVSLKPRPDCPLVCDVEVHVSASPGSIPTRPHPRVESESRGPAQVASARYRANWDLIWKRPSKPELAN